MAIYSLSHKTISKGSDTPRAPGAHVSYITRKAAATKLLGARMPIDPVEARTWLDQQEASDRKNARIIDKVLIALPIELNPEQQAELVQAFAEDMSKGRASWIAGIHAGPADMDNPHAHIIFRDRDFETGKRVMMTTERGSTERFREGWERHANRALERAGYAARIDRRTLEEQGIEREPQIHVGPKGAVLEEKGLPFRSAAIEVNRIFDNVTHPIIIDYAAIDAGRTRAEYNDEIKRRNAERERGHGSDPELDWTHREGMAHQQRSAMEWIEKARERKEESWPQPTRGSNESGHEMTDRRQEQTDRMAANSDMDFERARSLAARAALRESRERDRDDDGGRQR